MFSLTKHSVDILYLLTLGYMFRFSRNHRQALSKKKYKDPLHKTIKTRFGISNVYNKHLVMIHTHTHTQTQRHMYHNQRGPR